MPGYIIHLTEAKIICNLLKNGSQTQKKTYINHTRSRKFFIMVRYYLMQVEKLRNNFHISGMNQKKGRLL